MKKLMEWFRNLPPELRMLIALAGFGTPVGIIYGIKYYLFPNTPIIVLIIATAVLVAVISGLGFLINRLFGSRARRRRQDMEKELASAGTGGPVGMDVRAAIKENNEKFFNAVREMRKTLGLSVYDLPWYIVIGDSGCGKTKLINEGGLVFSTGRPEGYQLGTLNYNWWFTEDAIFIDMAGRLCNPQEDSDRREWLAFLDTISKGRRGYPINGAIVCVSADHLLSDPPEKHEQDANTMLERLRDLQNRLGVTFATYLVITKCDKILGFMPFFDRPGKDISFKNQMFGWSKPGAYNELIDPEKFDVHFDGLYRRLCELRLRRLGDDADEIELGLAYAFPEEFRTLAEPLKTYLRILFPPIKNPRAIKNLLFRGLYFTSATQEGEVVLKHLRQRLGEDAARQFQPLESLYPNPRPHFVKDFLVRKVIPEQGLVFRNEQEVVRNRKLARLLSFGSVALALMLAVALIWSFRSFQQLIGQPRDESRAVRLAFDRETNPAAVGLSPVDALKGATALGEGARQLQERMFAARVLSLGYGTGEPVRNLTWIRTRLFEEGVLRPMLRDVERVIRQGSALFTKPEDAEAYRSALLAYVRWAGCSLESRAPAALSIDDFDRFAAILRDPASAMTGVVKEQRDTFRSQAQAYMTAVLSTHLAGAEPMNPARLLAEPGFDPTETIAAGVRVVYTQFEPSASLTPDHPNYPIREWVRIAQACKSIEDSYNRMVGNTGRQGETLEQLAAFSGVFTEQYNVFKENIGHCLWQRDPGQPRGRLQIPSLREVILRQREQWVGYEAELVRSFSSCGRQPDAAMARLLRWLTAGDEEQGIRGLDATLAESLRKDVGLTDRVYGPDFFDKEDFHKRITEIPDRYRHIIVLNDGREQARDDTIGLTRDAQVVADILSRINERFGGLDLTASADLSGETLSKWKKELPEYLDRVRGAEPSTAQGGTLAALTLQYKEEWKEKALADLLRDYDRLGTRGQGNRLLRTILLRLNQLGEWGLAEATAEWRDPRDSRYTMALPPGPRTAEPPPPAVQPTPQAQQAPSPSVIPPPAERRVRRPGEVQPAEAAPAPAPVAETPVAPPPAARTEGKIPAAATAQFLNKTLRDLAEVRFYLKQFEPTDYLAGSDASGDLPKQCLAALESRSRAYLDHYIRQWAAAYAAREASRLVRMEEQAKTANTLDKVFEPEAGGQDPREVGVEVREIVGEVLRNVRWARIGEDGVSWEDFAAKDPSYREDFQVLTDHWNRALGQHWTGNPRLIDGSRMPAAVTVGPDQRPWDLAARDIENRWSALVAGLQEALPLPTTFNGNIPARAEIAWGSIDELRRTWSLEDERFTGRMQALAEQARTAVNRQISAIVAGLQSRYFGEAVVFDGWPYINPAGTGAAATDTVDYARFRQFLAEVAQAERIFQSLERGVAENDRLRAARASFYAACSAWYRFLGGGPEVPAPPITMTVAYQDPLNFKDRVSQARIVEDTAQFFYGVVELMLGLRIQQGTGAGGETLRIPTTVEASHRWEATWNWTVPAGGGEMALKFDQPLERPAGGRCPDLERIVLGRLSPLSFPAYLHRYGQEIGGGTWITIHAVDLKAEFTRLNAVSLIPGNDKDMMAAAFSFELRPAVPPPIAPLVAP